MAMSSPLGEIVAAYRCGGGRAALQAAVYPFSDEAIGNALFGWINESDPAAAGEAFAPGALMMASGLGQYGSIISDGLSSGPRFWAGGARVRHHTNLEGLAGIKESGVINAGRRGAVFVETEPFGGVVPQSLDGPKARFGAQEGAFIEFDALNTELFFDSQAGPANSFGIRGNVSLIGRNPNFVKVNWWYRFTHWLGIR